MGTSMIEEHRSLFKIVSVLLVYPQEELLSSIPELRAAVVSLQASRAKSVCTGMLGYLESKPLISLQEEYTRAFDLNPATCLNLTYHQLGNSRERGQALAELIQRYRNAGYETPTDELPDYLPMMLEFLSVCSPESGKGLVENFEVPLRQVAEQLRKMGSPYAGLLEAVCALPYGCAETGD